MGEGVMDEATLERVLQRLDCVERRVRWWQGVGVAAVVLLGLVVLMGATKGQVAGVAEEVRAKRVVVVDDGGNVRAQLGVIANETVLDLYNADHTWHSTLASAGLLLVEEKPTYRVRAALEWAGLRVVMADNKSSARLMP
jgi:hypothetical protein